MLSIIYPKLCSVMKLHHYALLGLSFFTSSYVYAQTPNETAITSGINVPSSSNVYHDYAVLQAKRVWGDTQSYTPEQQVILKKIEARYAQLDAEYQQAQLTLQENKVQTLAQQLINKPFLLRLDELYQAEDGKKLLQKNGTFELKKQTLLHDLPQIVSHQATLKSNMDSVLQSMNKDTP